MHKVLQKKYVVDINFNQNRYIGIFDFLYWLSIFGVTSLEMMSVIVTEVLVLSGALMKHFLEGSALLRSW